MELITINAFNEEDLRRLIREELDGKLSPDILKNHSERNSGYLNRFEVAELLRISLPTLANWSKEGILQSYRIGKRVLYREDEVNSSLQKVRNLKYKRGEV
jgi:excisionase family DNA binding protein